MADKPDKQPGAGGAEGAADSTAKLKAMAVDEIFLQEQFEESGLRYNLVFIVIAVVLHAILFAITFPEIKYKPPEVTTNRKIMVVRKYIPPPPKQKPKKKIQKKFTKKIAVPDPTPDEPEPIIEPEPEPEPEPIPEDVDIVLGNPEPPPVSGPLMPGIGGVTEPELIPETKVKPEYPELARKARIQGKVILQAVIRKDGTVGDIKVLKEPAADLGFAEAAIAAVKQWRYRPAMQNGRPVDVYFTVVVNFTIE